MAWAPWTAHGNFPIFRWEMEDLAPAPENHHESPMEGLPLIFFVGCLESDRHTELVLLIDPAVYQKCCFKKCFFDWEPRAVPDIPLPASCWNRVDHSKHLRWYSLVPCTYIEILSFCLHIANHFNSLSSNKTCKICLDLRLRTCYELIPLKSSFCSWNFQLERVALPLLEELSKGSVG